MSKIYLTTPKLSKFTTDFEKLINQKLNKMIEDNLSIMSTDGKIKHFLERRNHPNGLNKKYGAKALLKYRKNFYSYLKQIYCDPIVRKLSHCGIKKKEMKMFKNELFHYFKSQLIEINQYEEINLMKIDGNHLIKHHPVKTKLYKIISAKQFVDFITSHIKIENFFEICRLRELTFDSKGKVEKPNAFTFSPLILNKENDHQWIFNAEVQEDYYEWINGFEAIHPKFGKVCGNLEKHIKFEKNQNEEELLIDFIKQNLKFMLVWNYLDI